MFGIYIMKKILFSISCLAVFMTGCATPVNNAVVKRTDISKPPIGSTVTAYVGEPMLEQGYKNESQALVLPSDTKVSMYTLPAGQYLMRGHDEKGQYFGVATTSGVVIQKKVLSH